MKIKRGEIWMVNLPSTGNSIQSGFRPCIIVSNEQANMFSSVIHIVPLTSKESKAKLPTHVIVEHENLKVKSTAMCEQNMLIDKNNLVRKVCDLDARTMNKIDVSLLIQFGIYNKVVKAMAIHA